MWKSLTVQTTGMVTCNTLLPLNRTVNYWAIASTFNPLPNATQIRANWTLCSSFNIKSIFHSISYHLAIARRPRESLCPPNWVTYLNLNPMALPRPICHSLAVAHVHSSHHLLAIRTADAEQSSLPPSCTIQYNYQIRWRHSAHKTSASVAAAPPVHPLQFHTQHRS